MEQKLYSFVWIFYNESLKSGRNGTNYNFFIPILSLFKKITFYIFGTKNITMLSIVSFDMKPMTCHITPSMIMPETSNTTIVKC